MTARPLSLLLTLALLFWLPGLDPAHAGTVRLGAQIEQVNLAAAVELLEDPTGLLTLADVSSAPYASRFKAWNREQDVNVSFSRSTWWFRVSIAREAEAPENWVLQIPYTYNRQLDFFAPDAPPVLTGSERPLTSRPVFHPTYLFPIQADTTPQYHYFRVESDFAISLPLIAWRPVPLFKASLAYFFGQALYYGGALALILYNLFLAVSLRDVRFFLYVGFVSTMALGIFSGNGLGRLFLWPDWSAFDTVASLFFITIGIAFSVLFSSRFLQTRQHSPAIGRLLEGLAFALFLIGSLQLIGIYDTRVLGPIYYTNSAMVFVVLFALLWASYRAIQVKVPATRLLVTAWSAFWLGGLIATFRILDWIPTNTFTSYAVQIATSVEMVLLAFALAEMVKIERRQRLTAQLETIAAKQNLLDLMRAQEERLERTIQERTTQLEQALVKEKRILSQYMRFGALISHEFRNPLGAINSQATLLHKEQALDHRGLERVSIIKSAVERLVRLFNKWLEGDRIRNLTEQQVSPRWISAGPWLRSLLEKNALFAETHHLEIAGGRSKVDLWADPDLLEIATLNLIENACKYSPPGSRIVLEPFQTGVASGISIRDQGPGIPESRRLDIFEDYVRLDDKPQSGLGLGLSFVRRIMEAHQGEVTLGSAPGSGSVFSLVFPYPLASSQPPSL